MDMLMWHSTLRNLREKDNEYLYGMRASCEKMLNHAEHGALAQVMLDAVDHILKERDNG